MDVCCLEHHWSAKRPYSKTVWFAQSTRLNSSRKPDFAQFAGAHWRLYERTSYYTVAYIGTRVDTRVVTTRRTTPLNFSSFGERSQKAYVYCENSEDLSVNLIETHSISRGFRLERSSNNTVLLSRCHMSLGTVLY
jgi:hypothetical protein